MRTALQALEGSGLVRTLQDSLWAYPAIETLHIIGLATLFGSVLIVDLRLIGLARAIPVSRLTRLALPWSVAALLLMVLTGSLLFTAHPGDYLANRLFTFKMLLIVAALANAGVLHTTAYARVAAWDTDGAPPAGVRAAAGLSIVLWIGVIACGRMLAYV